MTAGTIIHNGPEHRKKTDFDYTHVGEDIFFKAHASVKKFWTPPVHMSQNSAHPPLVDISYECARFDI
jgi:hypothetical protein